MKMCAICKERPAVVFVSKSDGQNVINEGYCFKCATESGIAPINQIAEQFGITQDDIKEMTAGIQEALSDENLHEAFMDIFGTTDLKEPPKMNAAEAADDDSGDIDDIDGDDDYDDDDEEILRGGRILNPLFHGLPPGRKPPKGALETYGDNLTKKARESLLDRVIGREREIERVMQILNRRSKNNPVLLGEPGVGKTAIAEGIAQCIADGKAPEKLCNKEVYLLDMTDVVAGTQYRGQFESRLKNIIDEAKGKHAILVIDEVHSIVSAGDAEGALDAANILKPALAKGDIQVIGATTPEEYRKYIEKDTALERRFQPVTVEEPTADETVEILLGSKDYYENFHNVTIDDYVIREAVALTDKYIHDRFQPDKSIDVIDEAASRLNMESPYTAQIREARKELHSVIKHCSDLAKESHKTDMPFEILAKAKTEKCRCEENLNALLAKQRETKITVDDVARVIELWTGIPVKNITESDKSKLLSLEERLHRRIVGQDRAVSSVAKAVRRNRALKMSKKRPVSFIFVGPTGVGKTELVKALAESLFGDEDALIRIDMSEYMEKHTVSKLIGAPPGYVGYGDAGQLTEKVRRKPYSVVLLDEIEKANADVFNLLLQILDDGRITDSQGRLINFENTIIIMTSNAGTSVGSASGFGFMNTDGGVSARIDSALKELFRPEFLNRVDEVIEFESLTREQLFEIVDLMLADIVSELSQMGIGWHISDAAKQKLIDNGYNQRMGARPIRREIQMSIEDPLANILLGDDIPEHSAVNVDVSGGKISVTLA